MKSGIFSSLTWDTKIIKIILLLAQLLWVEVIKLSWIYIRQMEEYHYRHILNSITK